MNIHRYAARIGYAGPLTPSLATFRGLHVAHLTAVPFENLDIGWGVPITLDRERIYQKIVENRRGGFCYELNGLFAWLLAEIGFQVALLAAQDHGADGVYGPEFDHLTLRVETTDTDEPWLADVGWGDSFRQPLRLDSTEPQVDGARLYRIDQEGEYRFLWQRDERGVWEQQYRFTLEPRRFADFAATCQYHQTSSASMFTRKRLCTMATADGRITLTDNHLIITRGAERPGVFSKR